MYKRQDEAVELADWMIANYPAYWDAYLLKAEVYRRRETTDQAVAMVERVLTLLQERVPGNRYDLYRMRLILAKDLIEIDRQEEAKAVCIE